MTTVRATLPGVADAAGTNATGGAQRIAAYVGRYGWVDVDFAGIPDAVLREIIDGAWARTAPKRLVASQGPSR